MNRLRRNLARVWQRLERRWASRAQVRPALPRSAEPVVRLPATHQAAIARLVQPAVVQSAPYRDRVLSVPWYDADPDLIAFQRAFIAEMQRRGLPFFAHTIWRDEVTQNRLYREGRTRARFGQSAHNYGMAVDIVHFGRYWDLTEKEWAVIGLIGKEVARKRNIKVTWGGDWSFYDPAHWELADWRQRADKGASITTRAGANAGVTCYPMHLVTGKIRCA